MKTKIKNQEINEKALSNSNELSEDELDNVAGGQEISFTNSTKQYVQKGTACSNGQYQSCFGTKIGCYDYPVYAMDNCLRKDNVENRKLWAYGCQVDYPQCGSCINLEFTKDGRGYCGKSNN